MGRVLELKNEMVLLEFSEYHYFDDVLSDLKLTPVSNNDDKKINIFKDHVLTGPALLLQGFLKV